MIDSHAHLGMCKPGAPTVIAAAREAEVRRILTVGIDDASNREAIAAAEAHPEVLACVGRHPNSAGGFDHTVATEIEELAAHERVAAVGETGLDFYRDYAPRDDQRRAFAAQIAVARAVGKPVVIHMRDGKGRDDDAVGEVFETLVAEAGEASVVLHCFSATAERAREAAERGWLCSFAGNVTYPAADELREAVRTVPDDLLLVETDSPFLAPQPVRGKPNEPANVVATAKMVADERGLGYADLERLVERNAQRVFGW